MADDIKLLPNGLWPGPIITGPGSGATLSPNGFFVTGIAASGGIIITDWKLEFWGTRDPHYSEGAWIEFNKWIPGTDFPPGIYHFKLRFRSTGIWSDWSERYNLTMPAPKPPIPEISIVTVSPGGEVAVNGVNGVQGSRVEIWRTGGHDGVPAMWDDPQFNGAWRVASIGPWPPKKDCSITAKQITAGQESGWAADYVFDIPPLEPTILKPDTLETGLRPEFSGGCMAGATVVLRYVGGAPLGPVTVTGTTWRFTPTADLLLGRKSVEVIQTVNDVPSLPSTERAFTVVLPRPEIADPTEDEVVDIGSVIRGSGGYFGPGAKVSVQRSDSRTEWATATADANGGWTSTPLTLGPGSYDATARNEVNGQYSDYSQRARKFKIRPPIPKITFPVHEGKTSGQRPRLEGEGYSGSRLEVRYLDETSVAKDVLVGDGSWFHPARDPWDLGQHTLEVQQTFEGQASGWSDPHTFNVIPDEPSFTEPEKDAETSSLPTIGGKSLPYADVTVRLKGGRVLFTKPADADGVWSDKVTNHLDVGEQLIEAQQELNGHVSEWSDIHTFIVKKDSLHQPPGIIAPRDGGSMGANKHSLSRDRS